MVNFQNNHYRKVSTFHAQICYNFDQNIVVILSQ